MESATCKFSSGYHHSGQSSRQLSIQGLVTGSIPGELILDKHFGQHDFKLISLHRRSLDRRSLDRRSLTCRSLDYRSLARLPLARLPLAHMPLLTCRSLTTGHTYFAFAVRFPASVVVRRCVAALRRLLARSPLCKHKC